MTDLPEPARRYLEHVIAPDAVEGDAVVADIHGRIKLNDKWWPFRSTLHVQGMVGFHWKARVGKGLLQIRGHDRYVRGAGEMVWKLFGLLPVVRAADANITRSARGRSAMEHLFLPTALRDPRVSWSETDDGWARASWSLDGEPVALELHVADDGRPTAIRCQRWGDATPDKTFALLTFGAELSGEGSWLGLTIPTKLRAGWHYGTPEFDQGVFWEGEVLGLRPAGPL